MKLGIVSAGIAVILAGPASADARAQTDSIDGRIFRDAVSEIARASNLPRLDSAALLPGVRREIRIYEGFGFGGNRVTRLVEHTHGVDGQFGVFWLSQNWMMVYSACACVGSPSAPMRESHGPMRTPLGYRVFQNWMPDSTSTDSGERAAAAASTTVWQAFKRRLDGI